MFDSFCIISVCFFVVVVGGVVIFSMYVNLGSFLCGDFWFLIWYGNFDGFSL